MKYRGYAFWLIWAILFFGAIGSRPAHGQFSSLLGGGPADEKVTVSAHFTVAAAGQPGQLYVTAAIKPGWHIYSTTQPPGGPLKTEIKFNKSDQYELGSFQPLTPPARTTEKLYKDLVIETHEGSVTWQAPLQLKPGVEPAGLLIKGSLRALACDPTHCQPVSCSFTARLGSAPPSILATTAKSSQAPPVPIESLPAPAGPPAPAETPNGLLGLATEAGAANQIPWRPYTSYDSLVRMVSGSAAVPAAAAQPPSAARPADPPAEEHSLLAQVVAAFFGGALLNLMPCVLPVIGLKILGFVEQAGHDRRHALLLNVTYSLGLLSVFLLLATMAVGLGLGWGQQFQSAGFNIFLACLVFAMGLSFLGVWEIPVPGFVGSGKAAQLAREEGLSAAFLKGMITTVLATPCTGPLMGGALGWAMKQSAGAIFAVFLAVGLGMASPYLAIGAYPRLIRFLPKPGAWMETFKQIMGFVLMATVIYLLTFLDWPYVVPTVAMFIVLWIACWWINRTPPTAELPLRLRAWAEAVVMSGVGWVLLFPGIEGLAPEGYSFRGLAKVMEARFEETTSRAMARRLDDYDRAGYELVKTDRARAAKTVLVDMTADWCLTCKTLEATMLNTAAVRQLIAANSVVALKADYTRMDPEVSRLLNEVKAGGVPVIAIYPAGKPTEPIVFRDGYTKEKIVKALQEAGPSRL